tara:strand:+ start:1663 stop:1884 length:222 start_codon:yes stop_codon:yes gene_type:complete
MVKKIRVIDDTPEEAGGINSGDRDMMEMAKTMDWKLWEILQIMQRLEKTIKEGGLNISTTDEVTETKATTKKK